MPVKNSMIYFYNTHEKYSESQDTIITNSNPIQIKDTTLIPEEVNQIDTVSTRPIREFDLSRIDSILRRGEARDLEIKQQRQQELISQRPVYRRKIDTSELMYKQFGIAGFPIKEKLDNDLFQQNFLYSINRTKPSEKKVKQDVFIESTEKVTTTEVKEVKITPKYITGRIHFDWITILLLGSFLLLGWVRLFNKKYLSSLVKSVLSFKESNTLYREKNSLMVRASFIINFLFVSNISVFTIQIRHYFNLSLNGMDDYILYFIVMSSILALYIFRAISSFFIGAVFLKQKVFSEYFHNANIFTKNTGMFLIPVVIALQFLTYEYIGFIIYTGIAISGLLYILHVFRAIQINIKKNVSIFYMILYLCAFEISPFLIAYKVLLSVE
jgi:Domain of unknown function (DUF4271)